MQRVVILDSATDLDIGCRPAAGRIEQGAVEGEAGAGADAAGKAGLAVNACNAVFLVPVIVQIALDTGAETVGNFPVISVQTTESVALAILLPNAAEYATSPPIP